MSKHKIVLMITLLLLLCLTIPAFAKDWSVDELRQIIAKERLQWVAGETSMSRLPAELRKMSLGIDLNKKEDYSKSKEYIRTNIARPESLDYRKWNGKNWLTPIKDQKQCGSCWCFAQLGIVEVSIKMLLNIETIMPDISEQYIVSDCYQGGSCNGGPANGALAFMETHGVPWESCWPYEAKDRPCADYCSDASFTQQKVYSNTRIPVMSPELIKQALADNKGCIASVMSVYYSFNFYKSGVYEETANDYVTGGHQIIILGYSDNPGGGLKPYWICKNSWGTNWGEAGYFRIKYGNKSGIGDSGCYYVTLIADNIANHLWYLDGPKPKQYYATGTKVDIKWHAKGVTKINILYSSDNKATWNNIVTNYDATKGTYSWTIPSISATSDNCFIKILDPDHTRSGRCAIGEDFCPDRFGMGEAKSISLVSPNGGETYYQNHKYYIRWNYSGPVKNVSLYLSTDGGTTWLSSAIAKLRPAADKAYLWTVDPAKFPATSKAKIKVVDAYYESQYADLSDNNFSISNATFGFNSNTSSTALPKVLSLSVSPNPARGQVDIKYTLPKDTKVTMKVRNILGQTIETVMSSESHKAGEFYIHWLANGEKAGLYFIEMTCDGKTLTKNFLLLK